MKITHKQRVKVFEFVKKIDDLADELFLNDMIKPETIEEVLKHVTHFMKESNESCLEIKGFLESCIKEGEK